MYRQSRKVASNLLLAVFTRMFEIIKPNRKAAIILFTKMIAHTVAPGPKMHELRPNCSWIDQSQGLV